MKKNMGIRLVAVLIALTGGSGLAAEKEKITVDMFGSQMGSYGYIVMYAASEIVNKYHPGIKAVIHESFGALDNIRHIDADPNLRKHAFFMTSVPAMYGARAGKPKNIFPRPIEGVMNLFNSVDGTYTLITSNPNIKTPADLVGKKVDVGAYGNFMGVIGDYLLEAYGVKDKVAQLEHNADQKVMYDNLKSGKIDVSTSGILKMGEKISLAASTRELMAARTVHPVGYSKEMILRATQLSGIPFSIWDVPAGAFTPQTPSYTTLYYPLNVVSHKDMPEELVYEVMKVLIEHVDEFKKYSMVASWLTKQNMAAMQLPVSDFHPGAVKAYREVKAKIGEENFQ